ncbi:MAG: ABC transporter substrate-binding protein [Cetobacterium sp.]
MKRLALFLLTICLSNLSFALNLENGFIIDSKGNKIVEKKYEKILILDPAAVESFYLIKAEERIVAIADTAKNPIWPKDRTKNLQKAGTIMKPSIEKVLSFNPDLVILNSMSEGFAESLKSKNINFIINEANSFEEILANLKIYGIITDKVEESEKVIENYRIKLQKIDESIKKKPLKLKGAFLFSTSPMMVFTEKSLPGEVFKTLGIENIAKDLPGGRPVLTSEFLLIKNPDVLVGSMAIKNKNDILNSNPIVKRTKAGKNKNIIIIDSDKILRGTPRVIDALEELYEELLNVK